MWIDNDFNLYDPAQYGVFYYVLANPTFWFLQVASSQANDCTSPHYKIPH